MLVTIPFENSPTSERWDPRRTAHYLLQARRALVSSLSSNFNFDEPVLHGRQQNVPRSSQPTV